MTARKKEPRPSARQEVSQGFVAVGRILGPHGLKGDVRVAPLTDFPDRFAVGGSLYVTGQRHLVERCRWHRDRLYLKLSGIDDRSAAEGLRHHYLEVPEQELQPLGEGQYYHFQIVGLAVRSSQGEALGRVSRIISTPGNDVFVVQGLIGELLIPAVDEVVKEIDLEKGLMVIELVPGLLPSRDKK